MLTCHCGKILAPLMRDEHTKLTKFSCNAEHKDETPKFGAVIYDPDGELFKKYYEMSDKS